MTWVRGRKWASVLILWRIDLNIVVKMTIATHTYTQTWRFKNDSLRVKHASLYCLQHTYNENGHHRQIRNILIENFLMLLWLFNWVFGEYETYEAWYNLVFKAEWLKCLNAWVEHSHYTGLNWTSVQVMRSICLLVNVASSIWRSFSMWATFPLVLFCLLYLSHTGFHTGFNQYANKLCLCWNVICSSGRTI